MCLPPPPAFLHHSRLGDSCLVRLCLKSSALQPGYGSPEVHRCPDVWSPDCSPASSLKSAPRDWQHTTTASVTVSILSRDALWKQSFDAKKNLTNEIQCNISLHAELLLEMHTEMLESGERCLKACNLAEQRRSTRFLVQQSG